jgi:acetyl-CoA acyltransferase 2
MKQNTEKDIVIVAAKRTPFGGFGASLAKKSPTQMAVDISTALFDQASLPASRVDACVMGNVIQSTSDSAYLSRHVGLKSGLPISHQALTVNRLCGSGFEAVAQAAKLLMLGEAEVVLAGGSESMSLVPFALTKARFGYRLGHGEVEDLLSAGLTDQHVKLPMAITAENLAEQYKISREECDALALESQLKASAAWERGDFSDEVVAVPELSKDEHIRPGSTVEGLAKLKPVFKADGVVTAGNASGMVDGAALLLVCTRAYANKNQLKPLAKILGWAAAGCDPKIMGIGPVPATQKLLSRMGSEGLSLKVSDFDLVEVNEAFASQYLAVERELGLDRKKTNACGGAIAIGHPLGATGARLVSHLVYALQRRGGGLGLATACIGGGQGMSLALSVE